MLKLFLTLITISTAHASSLYDQLCFETERLSITPLPEQYAQALQEIDQSDGSFVNISNVCKENQTLHDALALQDSFLHDNTTFSKENATAFKDLFYGVFLKSSDALIGCVQLILCPNGFIHTSSKIHKQYQGTGIATECKKNLLQHFKQQGWIPDAPWHGFSGMIHFNNKASLAYNLKCGYRIGAFTGDAVNIYYPHVVEDPQPLSYQTGDASLHDHVIELFSTYLKPATPEDGKVAQHNLRKLSFYRLMNVPEQFLKGALEEEIWFIIRALADNVIKPSDIPSDLQSSIFTLIKNEKSNFEIDEPHDIPEGFKDAQQQFNTVLEMIEKFGM